MAIFKFLLMAFLPAVVLAGCNKGGDSEEPPALIKTVSMAAQQGMITEGVEGVATFAVSTANIDNGKTGDVTWYTTTEGTTTASAPAGITPSVTNVASNAATVTMTAATTVQKGEYHFKVTIDGAVSNMQTLSVGAPAAVVPVSEVIINYSTLELDVVETFQLSATVLPGETPDKSVLWWVNDEATALIIVDQEGLVTAYGAGTATVTVSSVPYPDKSASCEITVLAPYQMTVSTEDASVSFTLTGTGRTVVAWGDGHMNVYTLSETPTVCTNNYSGSGSRTITINGDNVTGLDCRGIELTDIDTDGNSKLTTLLLDEIKWPTYERLVKTITVALDDDSDGTPEDEISFTLTYDDKQRVTSMTDGGDNTVTVEYSGNIVKLTVGESTLATLTLDALGRVTKKTSGDRTYDYEYSGEYIAKETRSTGTVRNYVWAGGNMTEESTDTYTYFTDREDRLNLCLTEPDIINAPYLKFPGACSKNFIATSPAYRQGLPADTWTYTWGADGWPTRIIEYGVFSTEPTTTYYTYTTKITYY